jgi:hypothetical protein
MKFLALLPLLLIAGCVARSAPTKEPIVPIQSESATGPSPTLMTSRSAQLPRPEPTRRVIIVNDTGPTRIVAVAPTPLPYGNHPLPIPDKRLFKKHDGDISKLDWGDVLTKSESQYRSSVVRWLNRTIFNMETWEMSGGNVKVLNLLYEDNERMLREQGATIVPPLFEKLNAAVRESLLCISRSRQAYERRMSYIAGQELANSVEAAALIGEQGKNAWLEARSRRQSAIDLRDRQPVQ